MKIYFANIRTYIFRTYIMSPSRKQHKKRDDSKAINLLSSLIY